MKRRVPHRPAAPRPSVPFGSRAEGGPQGVLISVPTVAALRDAELVLPPEAGEGEREGRWLGEGAPEA